MKDYLHGAGNIEGLKNSARTGPRLMPDVVLPSTCSSWDVVSELGNEHPPLARLEEGKISRQSVACSAALGTQAGL